jgi:hypothetical protein
VSRQYTHVQLAPAAPGAYYVMVQATDDVGAISIVISVESKEEESRQKRKDDSIVWNDSGEDEAVP